MWLEIREITLAHKCLRRPGAWIQIEVFVALSCSIGQYKQHDDVQTLRLVGYFGMRVLAMDGRVGAKPWVACVGVWLWPLAALPASVHWVGQFNPHRPTPHFSPKILLDDQALNRLQSHKNEQPDRSISLVSLSAEAKGCKYQMAISNLKMQFMEYFRNIDE